MADVANLEAALERTTIHDENDDQTASSTAYQKAKKVCTYEATSHRSVSDSTSHR